MGIKMEMFSFDSLRKEISNNLQDGERHWLQFQK